MSSKIQNNYDIKNVFKDNISSKYIQDNVFDNFDISDLLKKDLYIPKTDLSHFLYKKDINNSNLTSTSTDDISQPDKIQDEIITEINNTNHFNIELEKLILTFKNGYEVPFINLYKPIKLIGQGHFGMVLSVIYIETNKKMAVKIIKKKKYSDEYYLLETKMAYSIEALINNKNASKYIQDTVFDNFDISDLLKKDLFIPKTNLNNFLYKKDIYNSNLSSTSTDENSQPEKVQDDIISEINSNNHFNIEIEKLILTFKNGYEVPFINLYTPIKIIGQGNFGLVLSCIHNKKNKKMAVKIIKKKYSDEYHLFETNVLKKLNHERIIKLFEVINTKKYLFIFTELCEGGSLKDFIISRYNSNKNYFIKDSECATIIKNILQGVDYLANNGIIHRDLKPENIMFRKENDINSLVLCDFGLAGEILGNKLIECKCGTFIFMAPEVLMNRKYDSLIDLWSVGIIMYILESGGRHPIYEQSMHSDYFIEFIKNKNKISFPDSFPSIARNFFLKLCKYDPFFRYNILKALNHPWIIRLNYKIPLTAIEDIEKEQKIKNFKNMLISMVFLKEYKNYFKNCFRKRNRIKYLKRRRSNNNHTINCDNNKLRTPLLKLDKGSSYLNNIVKVESNLDHNLPLLNKHIPRDILKMYTYKSLKNIKSIKQNVKPNNLFIIDEKKNNIKNVKYKLGSIKDNDKNKSTKDISIQRNHKNSIEILKEFNSSIKIHPSIDKRNNLFRFASEKRIRLLSSKKLKNLKDENILQKIIMNTPKAHNIMENKINYS